MTIRSRVRWVPAVLLAIGSACAVPALAIVVGPNPLGTSVDTGYSLGNSGPIGTNEAPIPNDHDTDAGPWRIDFTVFTDATHPWPGGTSYVVQHLQVDPTDTWTGWVQQLVVPTGWRFDPNAFGFLVAGSAPTGLSFDLNADRTRMDISFDPLPDWPGGAGGWIVQSAFGVVCPGAPYSCSQTFSLSQYPIAAAAIPEPASSGLLLAGLAGIAWLARARRR